MSLGGIVDLRERYRRMLRIRMVEETIARRYPEQEMRCPVHLSIGQEAAAVGACAPLGKNDVIFTTHRSHAHYLAKGGRLRPMIAELYGRETGCCGGRGGSMHLFDDDAGVVASVPIVASNIPLAVGAALAFNQRSEPHISVAFLGDAATEEGVFHESLNFAALQRLPVVFFVENNRYSVYTPIEQRQPSEDLTRAAGAHAIPTLIADGNDVMAVECVMTDAVSRARAGEGPTLVVVDTYRLLEHCGPADDTHLGYRSRVEVEQWKARCPLATLAKVLGSDEGWGAWRERTVGELEQEIELAFEDARASAFPAVTSAAKYTYATSLFEVNAR